MKRWILLDRDGTLNEDIGYLHEPEKAALLDGVVEGLKKLSGSGFRFIVVTNQSGIGRGFFTEKEMRETNEKISGLLSEHGIKIAGFYFCPHAPEEDCDCRKPKTKLVRQAERELSFSNEEIACVIGDKEQDLLLGKNLGVPSLLVMTGQGQKEYDRGVRGTYNAKDLNEAADILVGSACCK